jgi:hypothetical protein
MAKRSMLSSLSVSEILRELNKRKRGVASLQRKRAKLTAKLEALDARIAELGGSVSGGPMKMRAGGGRKRPKNDSNLVDALRGVLKGKTMGVSEAADAVQKAGYATSSPNFRTIVNQALIASGKFKRVSRGQYTAA